MVKEEEVGEKNRMTMPKCYKNIRKPPPLSLCAENQPSTDLFLRECDSDKELLNCALSRSFAQDTESLERSVALLTACCMINKISFEKIFTSLKKKLCKSSPKRLKLKKQKKTENDISQGRKKNKKKVKKNVQTSGEVIL